MTIALRIANAAWRSALTLFLVSLVSWTLVECAPGSTAERAAVVARSLVPGDLGLDETTRAIIVADAIRDFQLELSPTRRALRALRFDFGLSWREGQPALASSTGARAATTLMMVLAALALAFVLGLWGATVSAQRPTGFAAKSWSILAALVLSVPLPWLAMLAIDTLVYGRPLRAFPSAGDGTLGLLLPVLILSLAPAAIIWRHARQEMLGLADASWVVAARARGNSETRLWRVLILRASLGQVLPLVPVMLAYLLAASVLVERVFGLHGAGERLAVAAEVGDAPVLIAFAALSGLCIALASSLVDLLIVRLDPRRAEP